MDIIIAIIMFLLVITIHELGHFIAAKKSNIYVEEFSIGMGPKFFSKETLETNYSLRILPIGGYVSMENVSDNNPKSFNNASVIKRIIVILSGAFMNFILALITLFFVALYLGSPTTKIGEVALNSPAYNILEVNDTIIAINGDEIEEWEDIVTSIKESQDKNLTIQVIRDGQNLSFELSKDENNQIGIYPQKEVSIINSIKGAFKTFYLIIGSLINFLFTIFTKGLSLDQVSGPVGIISTIGDAAKLGVINLMLFFAYININVGFLNLLPLPPLDGIKFWILVLEGIRKKPLSQKLETTISLIGFILIMSLIILITINDIGKLR